jgi:glycosyltransferase involved in cell wall biosynthesis
MKLTGLLTPMAFQTPAHLSDIVSWHGHVPFAFWCIDMVRPRVLVELGTHKGDSYASFCQAVKELSLPTSCYAIDTWQGDEHAGLYGEEVFAAIDAYNAAHFGAFSRLVRSTFDEAVKYFEDGSIDLLHIDGLHLYEAVKHDFETWLPKLGPSAVVLLHDVNVREREFGVWRLWRELCERYPHFQFLHSHGLGVLAVGEHAAPAIKQLCGLGDAETEQVRAIFARLGRAVSLTSDRNALAQQTATLGGTVAALEADLAAVRATLEAHAGQLAHVQQELAARDARLASLQSSLDERDAAVRAAEVQLAHIAGESVRREQQIAASGAQLRSDLKRMSAELDAARATVRAQDEREVLLRKELDQREARITELGDNLGRLYQSWSWRVGRPIRMVSGGMRRIKRLRCSLSSDARALRKSGLFDEEFYRRRYPDVAATGVDPVVHYLLYGAGEGRDPSERFSTAAYAAAHAELASSGINPLVHYVQQRGPEGVAVVAAADPVGLPPRSDVEEELASLRSLDDLPWRFTGFRGPTPAGRIAILLTSHDAGRTGAPLSLLNLLAELTTKADFECWVLLNTDGPLEAEFARHAPTLNLDTFRHRGITSERFLGVLASLFRAHATRGFALCNTVATPEINVALAGQGIPVVSWLHELPTSIDAYFGGEPTFRAIVNSSRRIILPAEFVKDAIVKRYGCDDAAKLEVLHYGKSSECDAERRDAVRRAVREELGIPPDAFIVLACGTADQRKGADLFVPIARRVLASPEGTQAWFVWVGSTLNGSVVSWCRHDAESLGIPDRIHFVGEREDVGRYFLAADIFALTSREDPFPLVTMEAMVAGLPVVAFSGSGGTPEVIEDVAGTVVPYMDVECFAAAIRDLLRNPAARREFAERGVALMNDHAYSWTRFIDDLRVLIERELGLLPLKPLSVSACVICYNHERYLEERLDGILQQTYPVSEIVFLDDASTDGSVALAQRVAERSAVPFRFIVNERNGGSPFAQWLKGIRAATSDLVWIAEGDDSCDRRFLEHLVPTFSRSDTMLAYSQSAPVDDRGERYETDYRGYTEDLSPDRWSRSYVNAGQAEVRDWLSIKNTIPSASAVVMRRTHAASLPEDAAAFRFAGDWYLYANVLLTGRVAFVPEVLNFHRRHGATVTSAIEREDAAIVEQLRVKAWIADKTRPALNTLTTSIAQTAAEYYRLADLHGLERPAFTENPAMQPWIDRLRRHCMDAFQTRSKRSPLLIVLGDAEVGGGQIAAIRLANALSAHERVFLCNARPEAIDPSVASRVGPDVGLLEGTLGLTPWALHGRRAEHAGPRVAEGERRIRIVQDLVRFHEIGTIVSHIWWADRFALAVNRALGLPWYVQMHGCYEALVEHPDWDPEFGCLVGDVMERAAGITYLSANNLAVFERGLAPWPKRLRLVPNGLAPASIPALLGPNEALRLIDELVFCLCSRAIPEKGWGEAIAATLRINRLDPALRGHRRARLLLVGDSEYAGVLGSTFAGEDGVVFVGQVANPLPIVQASDVGLLPSTFVSESAPLSIVEYLACGKPVIATDIGSIPDMVEWQGCRAGQLVSHRLGVEELTSAVADAMLRYMTQPELLEQHRLNARSVFDARFNLDHIAGQYLAFFDGTLESELHSGLPSPKEERHVAAPPTLAEARARLLQLGNHSHTSTEFQDDVLHFIDRHADVGGAVIEVGCYRGGLTAQLALVCRRLGKTLYVIDVDEQYMAIAKESVQAVTYDAHVRYYLGTFPQFVAEGRCREQVILTLIDADHRYDGVRRDITAVYAMTPLPHAVAFHDFSLRYVTAELKDVRVDRAILDAFGEDARYVRLGQVAGLGPTMATSPGQDGHYHERGQPEGVLLLCEEHEIEATASRATG